jgi:hypothetical protein
MRVLAVRGELRGASRSQEPNTCRIRITAQTWPTDFFLFGCIKGKLSNYNCESQEDVLNTITEIFIGFGQEVLISVLKCRANRPKWVTKQERKYSTQTRPTDCSKVTSVRIAGIATLSVRLNFAGIITSSRSRSRSWWTVADNRGHVHLHKMSILAFMCYSDLRRPKISRNGAGTESVTPRYR